MFTLYHYLKSLKISLPLAKSSNAIRIMKPVTCAYSKNLSPGFLPVIISHKVKTTCPPSRAGIGIEVPGPPNNIWVRQTLLCMSNVGMIVTTICYNNFL